MANLLIIVLIACLLFGIGCESNTFQPFIRSRYSRRWQKSTPTDSPNFTTIAGTTVITSTSTSPATTTSTSTSSNNNNSNDNANTDMNHVLEGVLLKEIDTVTLNPTISNLNISTHPLDYDYYGNNEIEDSDQRNN